MLLKVHINRYLIYTCKYIRSYSPIYFQITYNLNCILVGDIVLCLIFLLFIMCHLCPLVHIEQTQTLSTSSYSELPVVSNPVWGGISDILYIVGKVQIFKAGNLKMLPFSITYSRTSRNKRGKSTLHIIF